MIDFEKMMKRQIEAEERARAEFVAGVLSPHMESAIAHWLERIDGHIGQMRDEITKEAT
jgi:hypothetical protein